MISGDAGIGKTVLWRAAVEAAEAAGVRVLATRCVEAEMPVALGGLSDLLDETLEDVAADLAEPQRRALAVAIGLETPSVERPDPVVLPRAFLACLRALAGRSPVCWRSTISTGSTRLQSGLSPLPSGGWETRRLESLSRGVVTPRTRLV